MNLFTVYLEKIYQHTIQSSIVHCQENLNKNYIQLNDIFII